MMTRLQIATLACGSALMVSSLIGYYSHMFSTGPHPYWVAWMIVLAIAVSGLSCASALKEWKRKH